MFRPTEITLDTPSVVTRSRFTYPLTSDVVIEGEIIRHSNGEIDINYFADGSSVLFAMFAADTDRTAFEKRVVEIFERYERLRDNDCPY